MNPELEKIAFLLRSEIYELAPLQFRMFLPPPGQSVQFLFTRGGSGVQAWEIGDVLEFGRLDRKPYCTLLDRAIRTVLDPCKSQFTEKQLI